MSVHFSSTRGGGDAVSAAFAVVQGLCADGGLYVPDGLPNGLELLAGMNGLSYAQRSARVLTPLLSGYSSSDIGAACEAAYGTGYGGPVAPVRRVDSDTFALELFHGPTLAFKDVALQLLPRLLTLGVAAQGLTDEVFILVATSGDTGKAALQGFADVPGTRVAVFYPRDGVSEMQRLQMVTQPGGNVHVLSVQGNFDDAQTGVKRLFTDPLFLADMKARGKTLSSANSMNWGRLAPQIAYYFSAYADLVAQGHVAQGQPINVCVPTGNFGNILAAHYARCMGLPLAKLICASNANHVLTEFIGMGTYNTGVSFHLTASPSMDILVSSNLERLLYELAGGDTAAVRGWTSALANGGWYKIGSNAKARLQEEFFGGWCGDEETLATIASVYNETGYLYDTHTAVAHNVLRQYRAMSGDTAKTLVVATASPFKFARSVLSAVSPASAPQDDFDACRQLAELTRLPLPEALRALNSEPVRHTASCAPSGMDRALTALL